MAFMPRATHVLQWPVQRAANQGGKQIQKAGLSSDWSLQLDSMKSESLVIADQQAAVNTFPALYTPPVTPWKSDLYQKSVANRKEGQPKVWLVTGVKS